MKILTKTQIMQHVISGEALESFFHETEGSFDITSMRVFAKNHAQKVLVPIESIVTFIKSSRVVDEQRVLELSVDSWKTDPGIIVMLNSGEHLLIDGSHRTLRRELEGEEYALMYLVLEKDIIRVPETHEPCQHLDWGDSIIDGKIVKNPK